MTARLRTTVFVLFGALCLGFSAAWAQSEADSSFSPPRTSWGDPDLQGVWDYRTITPMQRPRQFGDREFYTDEEIAELEARAERRMTTPPDEDTPANLVHAQYMTDPGTTVDESRRTSLIIDPPNGQVPDLTPEARERQSGSRGFGREPNLERPWLERSQMERCISRGLAGSILPSLYNNNIQIVQAPGQVAIIHEMIHETRVIPLDDRERTGIPSYMGESRGHWEGDTLVVETTNFNDEGGYRGASENLKLTERYTRISPDRIDFRLTFEDETQWVQPWTVAYIMRPTDGLLYEYACHEGNYGLRNILENIVMEREAAGDLRGN